MTTILSLERELSSVWDTAGRNDVDLDRARTALYQLAGLSRTDVDEHARTLARIAGSEVAAGWITGLHVGLYAALRSRVLELTATTPVAHPRRHRILDTVIGVGMLATALGALAAVWAALITIARWVL